MNLQVPKFPNRILRIVCDQRFLEEVEGDLEEIFENNCNQFGRSKAARIYWLDVLKHVRPYFIKKRSINFITQNQTVMWTIYLKIAFRNFWKSKIISGINTMGLSLGLACCIIVFFHVKDELSYDSFIENGDHIYRVLNISPDTENPASAGGPVPLGPTLLEDFPGIDDAVRVWRDYQPTLVLGDRVFMENNFMFTDPSFFQMFSFPLRSGNPLTALNQPNTVVLTESMAQKYFGEEDPMGKTIEYKGWRGNLQLLVTGVMEDLPHYTHMSFDFLASFVSIESDDGWGSFKPIWTYITLKEGASLDDIRAGFPDFAKKYVPGRVEEYPGFRFDLEQMSKIYMHSEASRNMKPLGNVQAIYILSIVGFSILVIACINFINLTLANSLIRFKEVGIRKIMGAGKSQLVRQFMVESSVTIMISFVLSLFLVIAFLPLYNEFSNKEIAIIHLLDGEFLSYVVLGLIGAVIIAGIYPARFIARMGDQLVLGRSSDKVGSNSGARRGFVVFQFLVSAILIISILIIKQQQNYIFTKEIGIDKDRILVIPRSDNEKAFLQDLRSSPAVKSIGISQRLPVNTLNYDGRTFEVEGLDRTVSAQSCVIDEDFIETYGIEIIAGRNHFKERPSQWEFLINESAIAEFEWGTPENALGKKIYLSPNRGLIGNVIGVYKDFHLESLHEKIPPMIMFKSTDQNPPTWHRVFVSIKYNTDDLIAFTTGIEELWKSYNEDRAYFSFFIDDSYDDLHEADHKFATLFNYVTFVAILIACMGLLGLSMLIVNQKVKEIGIRKVLGASVLNITVLFSSRFVGLVLIGLILACPAAYYLMDQWLDGFSYRIKIDVLPFILAFLIVSLLSMLTIVIHTARTALINPAESLKDE